MTQRQQGGPGRHRVLRRRRRRRRRLAGQAHRARDRHRLGLRQLAGRAGRDVPAAVRDGPGPAAAVLPGQDPPHQGRAGQRHPAGRGGVAGRRPRHGRPGRRHHRAGHAGQLRCADRIPGAQRLGGLALRGAPGQPRLPRTWWSRSSASRSSRSSWSTPTWPPRSSASSGWRVGVVILVFLLPTGRKPELSLAGHHRPGRGGPMTDVRTPAPDQRAVRLRVRRPRAAAHRRTRHDRRAVHRGLLRRQGARRRRPAQRRSASSRTSTR